jgi:hypothetical protein
MEGGSKWRDNEVFRIRDQAYVALLRMEWGMPSGSRVHLACFG